MQTKLKSKWACGIIMVLALVISIINLSCEKTKEGDTQAQEGSQNSALPIPGDQTQTTASTATGMNPPHGQPGHRCDIAVGAPLDSPPGTGKTPPIASQQNVPAQTTTPTTAPGMNPPHGQPGHRCDIAVGAPLDSPPGTGKTPPVASQQNVPIQTTPPTTAAGKQLTPPATGGK